MPDRFYGGIIGAFVAAAAGAFLSGMLFTVPGIPTDNPPGIDEALWPSPAHLPVWRSHTPMAHAASGPAAMARLTREQRRFGCFQAA